MLWRKYKIFGSYLTHLKVLQWQKKYCTSTTNARHSFSIFMLLLLLLSYHWSNLHIWNYTRWLSNLMHFKLNFYNSFRLQNSLQYCCSYWLYRRLSGYRRNIKSWILFRLCSATLQHNIRINTQNLIQMFKPSSVQTSTNYNSSILQ